MKDFDIDNKDNNNESIIPIFKDFPEYNQDQNSVNHDHIIIPSYEQPNPSIATPHIPLEMPSRDYR